MQGIRSYFQDSRWLVLPVSSDRIGVVASVLCAIHCAATPVLLLFLPIFGKVWSHPASHWIMALLVVPLAVVTVRTGYKRHRRKWVIVSCFLGIGFVLTGAAAPGFEATPGNLGKESPAPMATGNAEDCLIGECAESESFAECEEGECETASECAGSAVEDAPGLDEEGCVDACCPSIQADAEGGWRIHVPLASVLTTIGGIFLIVTHIGNLCRCSCCHTEPVDAWSQSRLPQKVPKYPA